MKILIANKFYYPRGGDCVYAINLEELLKQKGHEVAVFAMQHPDNLSSPYSKYFPSEVSFSLANKNNLLESIFRPFGTKEVKKKFNNLLDDFQPDIVHLNNIHTQLSPLIAEIAYKRKIKVVWTLHDYKLLCPRYDCLLNGTTTCEKCFTDKRNVLYNNCIKNSKFASLLSYLEAKKWKSKRLENCTDLFICPSQFMKDKMVLGGFNPEKLVVLNNFIDKKKVRKDNYQKDFYYCYVGRLSNEKGIKTLLNVALELPYKLKIIGNGPLKEKLKKLGGNNIEILGYMPWEEIKEIVGQSLFSVIPSEWYENNPFSVIESLCLGTPVLGANIGGIPELTNRNDLNMTFKSKNRKDLQEKIELMWNKQLNEKDYKNLSLASLEMFNEQKHYDQIMRIYTNEKNN